MSKVFLRLTNQNIFDTINKNHQETLKKIDEVCKVATIQNNKIIKIQSVMRWHTKAIYTIFGIGVAVITAIIINKI